MCKQSTFSCREKKEIVTIKKKNQKGRKHLKHMQNALWHEVAKWL